MVTCSLEEQTGSIDVLGADESQWMQIDVLQHLIEIESARDESEKAIHAATLAARAKSDFLAMMSHEIRTPLNGIIGMTAVLSASNLAPEDRDCLDTIRKSGETLLAIINDVLDFSKIEAGCLELECATFEVGRTIEEALQIVQPSAARKSIRLVTHFDPLLPNAVRGDVVRFRQILLNLLSNAVKFTSSGTIEVTAHAKRLDANEYELQFAVRDEGTGIAKDHQKTLFEPFSQADTSITRRFGGTGLGLAICKRLTGLMGGAIGVESELGQGSRFWFTIKVLSDSSCAPSAGASEDAWFPVAQLSSSARNSARLLLVEDNRVNQKVALLMLKSLGYHADVAANGREAIEAVAAQPYDLVLMDCLMPEMDGFEATRAIRSAAAHNRHLPIIAMTANAFAEDRDACLSSGMSDFLSKPVRPRELAEKIAFWLSQHAC